MTGDEQRGHKPTLQPGRTPIPPPPPANCTRCNWLEGELAEVRAQLARVRHELEVWDYASRERIRIALEGESEPPLIVRCCGCVGELCCNHGEAPCP